MPKELDKIQDSTRKIVYEKIENMLIKTRHKIEVSLIVIGTFIWGFGDLVPLIIKL